MAKIDSNDLLVGEQSALHAAGVAFAGLRNINAKYLSSVIAKMEKTDDEQGKLVIPIYKLALFYAQDLQERLASDKALTKLLEDAAIQLQAQEAMGM